MKSLIITLIVPQNRRAKLSVLKIEVLHESYARVGSRLIIEDAFKINGNY